MSYSYQFRLKIIKLVIELEAGKPFQLCIDFLNVRRKQKKGGFIRINPQDAGVPKMHFLSLEMKALDALKAIDRLLNPSQQAVK